MMRDEDFSFTFVLISFATIIVLLLYLIDVVSQIRFTVIIPEPQPDTTPIQGYEKERD